MLNWNLPIALRVIQAETHVHIKTSHINIKYNISIENLKKFNTTLQFEFPQNYEVQNPSCLVWP